MSLQSSNDVLSEHWRQRALEIERGDVSLILIPLISVTKTQTTHINP